MLRCLVKFYVGKSGRSIFTEITFMEDTFVLAFLVEIKPASLSCRIVTLVAGISDTLVQGNILSKIIWCWGGGGREKGRGIGIGMTNS